MGNGNGLVSYGKSRALTPELSIAQAIMEMYVLVWKQSLSAVTVQSFCPGMCVCLSGHCHTA